MSETVYALEDPNPVPAGQQLTVRINREELCRIWIYDASGRRLQRYFLTGPETVIPPGHLPAGAYAYQVIGESFIRNGVFQVL